MDESKRSLEVELTKWVNNRVETMEKKADSSVKVGRKLQSGGLFI